MQRRLELFVQRPEGEGGLLRKDLWLAFALACGTMLAGSARMAPGVVGDFHDDAIYVITAGELAEGRGYRQSNLPGAPLQTKYPIAYPALLASAWPLLPRGEASRLVALQVLTLLVAAFALAGGYLYLVRFGYANRAAAAAAVALCMTSSPVLYFGTHLLSELPFAASLVVALWASDAELDRRQTRWREQLCCGLLIGLPFLMRTVGAAVAVGALFVLWRARRPLLWTALGIGLVALPWIAFGAYHAVALPEGDVLSYYSGQPYVRWFATGAVAEVLARNLLMGLWGTGWLAVPGLGAAASLTLAAASPIWIGLGLFVCGAVLVGFSRGGRALPAVLTAYSTVCWAWPWPPQRFLVPILPLLLGLGLSGLSRLVCRGQRGVFGRACSAGAGVAIVLALTLNLELLRRHYQVTRDTGLAFARLVDARQIEWKSYERALGWIRDNTLETDVIVSGLDTMVALYTRRTAYRPFVPRPTALFYGASTPPVGSTAELRAAILAHHARYLALFPLVGFAEETHFAERISELRRRWPGCLEPAYRGKDVRFEVLRINRDACSTEECG